MMALLAGPLAVGCDPDSVPPPETVTMVEAAAELGVEIEREGLERTWLTNEVVHYQLTLRLGDGPRDRVTLHRVVKEQGPWLPRAGREAIMLLHGDFSSFVTNFLNAEGTDESMALYLAERGIDVWGVDRRWVPTLAPEFDDLAAFSRMGLDQAVADTELALRVAHLMRVLGGRFHGDMAIGGFSRGAQLAYLVAAHDASHRQRPPLIDGLVALDAYAVLDPAEQALRDEACVRRDEAEAAIEAGETATDNGLFQLVGQLASSAPDEPSAIIPGFSNRAVLLTMVGQTHQLFLPAPDYHLAAATFSDGVPTGLRLSSEALAGEWLAQATDLQALPETAQSEALWCGAPWPHDAPLERIEVPLLYVGAGGGFGDYGIHSTTLVGSDDVTIHRVADREPGERALDWGHGDLLFAEDAAAAVWHPLLSWLHRH